MNTNGLNCCTASTAECLTSNLAPPSSNVFCKLSPNYPQTPFLYLSHIAFAHTQQLTRFSSKP